MQRKCSGDAPEATGALGTPQVFPEQSEPPPGQQGSFGRQRGCSSSRSSSA